MSDKKQAIQPDMSIGLVGHVDHGKTTLTEALSGKWTDTHSEELKRGITIRLGYANANIYEEKGIFYSEKTKPKDAKMVRTVSLVDSPGHESLMATMLSGAAIIDAALLMVSANEPCPQPQTVEHLMALEIIGIKNIIIVQNKIDIVDEKQAKSNYKEIKALIKPTVFKNAPIIPISAQHNVNMDLLLQTIMEHFKVPKRNPKDNPMMFVARSFDVNKPGSQIKNMIGGVLGGSLSKGSLKTGDKIEIKPGYMVEEKNKQVWKSLTTTITDVMSGNDTIKEAFPGGSIALLTNLDPSNVKSDSLAGSIVGLPGKLPEVLDELHLEITLLERVVGAKDKLVVNPIKMSEPLMINVNSATSVGIITSMKKKDTVMKLKLPVCADKGSRVTLSRQIGQRWRLIGFGIIK